jgi:hypothetical protein
LFSIQDIILLGLGNQYKESAQSPDYSSSSAILTMYTDAEKRLAVFIEQNVDDEDIAAYLEEVCRLLKSQALLIQVNVTQSCFAVLYPRVDHHEWLRSPQCYRMGSTVNI